MSSQFRFPRRVRIHGGDCGAVARALHHVAKKGALSRNEQSLISDEKAFFRQADSKKVFGSTSFERKLMSTKTTLKRIALVAVAALGMGLLSVVPAKAALNGTATPFSAEAALISSATTIGSIQYVVGAQTAGTGNFVPLVAAADVSSSPSSVAVSVTGSAIIATVPAKATWTYTTSGNSDSCPSATGYVYGSSVLSPGVFSGGKLTTVDTTALSAIYNKTSGNDCLAAGLSVGTATPAQVWVSAATAGGFTATVVKNDTSATGVTAPTTLQVFSFAVTTGAAYTASTVSLSATGDTTSAAYYNPYEGLYAPAGTPGATAQVGKITVTQKSGATTITSAALSKPVTVTLTGVGSLTTGVVGSAYKEWLTGTAFQTDGNNSGGVLSIPVYSDGRAGKATITVAVGGTTVSTKTVYFYGTPAKVTASLLRPIGKASSAGGTNGVLTYIDGTLCIKGTEDECNDEVGSTAYPTTVVGTDDTPLDPGDLNDPAVAVLVTDANGTPVPTAVIGTSSDSAVVSTAVKTWLLDSGAGANSVGTYYQHITYTTSPAGVKGKSATLTYSVVLANGTLVSSAPLTVTLGGAAATVTMTADKASYAPGEAGVITVTAKDSAGFAAYDGSALFSAVKINTTLFTGSVPSTSSTTVNGTKTFKFFAPIVAGTWTITGTLGDGTTVTLPITVKADTSAIDAAADAALQAVDAANAATEAANMAAEAADAATMAAQDAKDAADAATAAVEKLAQDVAAMIDAIKAQLKTLANIIAKIAKKVKA